MLDNFIQQGCKPDPFTRRQRAYLEDQITSLMTQACYLHYKADPLLRPAAERLVKKCGEFLKEVRMAKYSETSLKRLDSCHPLLQKLFTEVVLTYDCSILCGFRNETDQNRVFEEGRSRIKWPDSRHNSSPSIALDVVPYPIVWPETAKMLSRLKDGQTTKAQALYSTKDLARMYYFGGYVLGLAHGMGIPLRWGGDWDGDRDIHDQTFDDLPHFELVL